MNGAIVVDKPRGMTSHDVVNRMRRLASTRKVGHLGTLDPMATGVLPLLIGRATRLAQFFAPEAKVYVGTIRFGVGTTTYDVEGAPASPETRPSFGPEELEQAMSRFRGPFLQTPPPVSAKKVGGVRAYKLARRQVDFDLRPASVEVFELRLLEYRGTEADIYIRCSSGTYVRSIAHDLGQALSCGAFLLRLRRTFSGGFSGAEAFTLEQLAEMAEQGKLSDALIPAAKLLPHLPNAYVDEITENNIRMGKDFRVSPFRPNPEAPYIKAVSGAGELIAIAEPKLPHIYHPRLVL